LFYNIQSQTLISLLSLLSRRRCRKIPRRIRNRLEAVFSRAQKLVTEHFHGIEPYERERRIAILAYMKMLVELMKVSEP